MKKRKLIARKKHVAKPKKHAHIKKSRSPFQLFFAFYSARIR